MPTGNLSPQYVAKAIGGRVSGNKVLAHAPGHSNGAEELSITVDPAAPRGILVNCFSGEDPIAMKDWVLRQCGEPDFAPGGDREPAPVVRLKPKAPTAAKKRFSDRHLTKDGFTLVTAYDYADADGEIAFQVLRYEHPEKEKTFLQRHPDGRSGWFFGRADPILYRLPDILARPKDPVFFCEGEKDVDRLAEIGLLATTVPNGSWPDDLSDLAGRKVYVVPDNDPAGSKRAEEAIERLQSVARCYRVDLPDLPPKGDVSDWLDAGGDAAALMAMARSSSPVAANQNTPGYPGIISSGEFVRGFVPPDYHIDGIAQSSFLYALTAQTGAGKTAVLLLLTAHTALGIPMGGRDIRKGRVVYFAGENPVDVNMRWIGMAHAMGFNPDDIDVHFITGVFSIPAMFKRIEADVRELGGAELVIIDTSAAYFQGAEENSNTELGRHAREQRALTTLPGKPCVITAAHPVKNAGNDSLLPRGGGAFLAELDGNLVLLKGEGTVKLHWQGKHRGPDFEPIVFELQTITAPALRDTRNRDIPTVMAAVLSGGEVRQKAVEARRDEDAVLLAIDRDGNRSLSEMAEALGWHKDGVPHKDRVRRAADKLRREKLVTYARTKWKLTPAEHEAAVEARGERHHAEVAARAASGILAKHRAKAA